MIIIKGLCFEIGPIPVLKNGQTIPQSSPVDVAVGDFNGDGKLDFVTANSGTPSLDVAMGNGDGSLGEHPYPVHPWFDYPARAAAFDESRGYGGPLFNDFNWGGYLIWRLPGLPVSVDGRTNEAEIDPDCGRCYELRAAPSCF